MESKAFILSSSGLKNIIFKNTKSFDDTEDFRFIFGDEELKTNYLFAEFISPRVSQIHQIDPTINYINMKSIKRIDKSILKCVDELSRGNSIEVTKENIDGLQQISIVLGNAELFSKINELFDGQNEEEQIEKTLLSLQFIENEMFVPSSQLYNQCETIIDFIANHFYLIEEEKLLKIPKNILYSILCNQKLKLKNEDSLFDFINKLFEENNNSNNDNDDEYPSKTEFYETIEFTSLSEEKMNEFLLNFDSNDMTKTLWSKLVKCFYLNQEIVSKVKTVEERMSLHQTRYSKFDVENKEENEKYITIEYDNDQNNRFKGIITKLGRGDPSNVNKEKIIDVSFSYNGNLQQHQANLFDFNDDKKYFHSEDKPNSWVCYDFKERKVKLSHYSIRSHGVSGKTNNRMKTWVIEGSNDNNKWEIIDKRENEESVVDVSASNTFKINENTPTNDFYRYIRIRQTAVNSNNNNYLVLPMMEFFGTIHEP